MSWDHILKTIKCPCGKGTIEKDTRSDDWNRYEEGTPYINCPDCNNKYKNDDEECAKCIAHEYRHVFQIFYANLFDTETARRWKGLLGTQINSSNMKEDGSNYLEQELEINAFAFTKFYLERYEDMKVVNRIDGLDYILDLYIEENIRIM